MVGVRYLFLGFLSCLFFFLLACLLCSSYCICCIFQIRSLCFLPAWGQQFPLPGQSVPCSTGAMCSGHGTQSAGAVWLKGANLQLLRLSFCLAVCLCLEHCNQHSCCSESWVCVLASWPCSCNQQSISKEKLNFQNVHLQTTVKLPSWLNVPPWKPQKAVGQS